MEHHLACFLNKKRLYIQVALSLLNKMTLVTNQRTSRKMTNIVDFVNLKLYSQQYPVLSDVI